MTDSQSDHDTNPVLVYDGVCALCNAAVGFVLKYDTRRAIRFAALQGRYAAELQARHPELRAVDSIIFVSRDEAGEHVSVRSEAALDLAAFMGGGWKATRLLRFVPRLIRDGVYDGVARIRYRVFGRYDACPLPEPGVRERFLD